eukprot:snap_masked-scaffold131_size323982-processed-gene-1.0 protein:Tk05547 transcript:snap_masked-scaffold131_size323982-processed-gene-1.0-mRNA-1 annotation:"protein-methionine sulfoxide oxidase mical3-like isoform x2"
MPSAGYSEDSDYTSDINFPINSQIPNAATSQYLHVANSLQPPAGPHTPQKSFESYDSQYFDVSQEYPPNDVNNQGFPPQPDPFSQAQPEFQAFDGSIPANVPNQDGYVVNQPQEDWNNPSQPFPNDTTNQTSNFVPPDQQSQLPNGEDGCYEYDYENEGWYVDEFGQWQQDPFYTQSKQQQPPPPVQLVQNPTKPQAPVAQPSLAKPSNSSFGFFGKKEPTNQTAQPANAAPPAADEGGGAFGFMKSLISSSSTPATTTSQVLELNKKNSSAAHPGTDGQYNIPYGNDQADYSSYYEDGWFQDEYGQWFQDPAYAKNPDASKSGAGQAAGHSSYVVNSGPAQASGPASSSYVVSDNNKNAPQAMSGKPKKPDNYEEGWYQDESGEWLNEFDWHQDESGEWYYEDSYDYEADGWVQDASGEWVQQVPNGAPVNADGSKSVFKNISDLGGSLFGGKTPEQLQKEQQQKVADEQRQKQLAEQHRRQQQVLEQQKQQLEQERVGLEAEKQRQRQAEQEKMRQEQERHKQKQLENQKRQQMEQERLRQELARQTQEKEQIRLYQQRQEQIRQQQEMERQRLQMEQERLQKQQEMQQQALQQQQVQHQEALRKQQQLIEQERIRQQQQIQYEVQRQQKQIQMEVQKQKDLMEKEKQSQKEFLEKEKQSQKELLEKEKQRQLQDLDQRKKEDLEQQKQMAEAERVRCEGERIRREAEEQAKREAIAASTKSADRKLPPRPMDYDDYWYQEVDETWRNQYDDYGYEFDPTLYECDVVESKQPEASSVETVAAPQQFLKQLHETQSQVQTTITSAKNADEPPSSPLIVCDPTVERKSSTASALSDRPPSEADRSRRASSTSQDRRKSSTATPNDILVAPIAKAGTIPRPNDLALPEETSKADLSRRGSSVAKEVLTVVEDTSTKLPPRPADYDYFWYQDDDGNWRNEYDDEGLEFDESAYEPAKEDDFYTEDELQKAERELKGETLPEVVPPEDHKPPVVPEVLEVPATDPGLSQSEDEREDYLGNQIGLNSLDVDVIHEDQTSSMEFDQDSQPKERWHWAFHRIVQLMPKDMKQGKVAPQQTHPKPFRESYHPVPQGLDCIPETDNELEFIDAASPMVEATHDELKNLNPEETIPRPLVPMEVEEAVPEASLEIVPEVQGLIVEEAPMAAEEEYLDSVNAMVTEDQEEYYDGEEEYYDENEEYYEADENWEEEPYPTQEEAPMEDVIPQAPLPTSHVVEPVDEVKQAADEAAKAAAEAANAAAEASKSLVKGISNFGGGLMSSIGGKHESKPSTGIMGLGGSSPAQKPEQKIPMEVEEAVPEASLEIVPEVQGLIVEEAPMAAEEEYLDSVNAMVTEDQEEYYDGEEEYYDENEEYYEADENWEEEPYPTQEEAPMEDVIPQAPLPTSHVVEPVDEVKQAADEAAKAAAEAANAAAEASKSLVKGISNFGGGLMSSIGGKHESKPSTGIMGLGGSSPAQKPEQKSGFGFSGFGFGSSPAKKQESGSGFGFGGFGFGSPKAEPKVTQLPKKSGGFGFGSMLNNLEAAFDEPPKATMPPTQLIQAPLKPVAHTQPPPIVEPVVQPPPPPVVEPVIQLKPPSNDEPTETIAPSAVTLSAPEVNGNGPIPEGVDNYGEEEDYLYNEEEYYDEEEEYYNEEEECYDEVQEEGAGEEKLEKEQITLTENGFTSNNVDAEGNFPDPLIPKELEKHEDTTKDQIDDGSTLLHPQVTPPETDQAMLPSDDGPLSKPTDEPAALPEEEPFDVELDNVTPEDLLDDDEAMEEDEPAPNDVEAEYEPLLKDIPVVPAEAKEEEEAMVTDEIKAVGEEFHKPRTSQMNGKERWWWAYTKVRQMNWFFKQGYPPEVIDEFMAEQDIYDDQYYEETGYYDENGEWVEYPPEDQEMAEYPEGEQEEEFEEGFDEEEEKVPSPPPVVVKPKANGAPPKGVNDVIDKDLKAAQDAAKAAGDVAKNLIGGIGGSLLGGFSGGKKTGGFGLASFMGSPPKPAPQKSQVAKSPPKPKEPLLTPTPKPVEKTKEEIVGESSELGNDQILPDDEAEWLDDEEMVPELMPEDEGPIEDAFKEADPPSKDNPPLDIAQESLAPETMEAEAEKVVENIKADSDGEKGTPDGKQVAFAEDGRPKFVKHFNKTRTMSGRQKWDWAFEKIIQVIAR